MKMNEEKCKRFKHWQESHSVPKNVVDALTLWYEGELARGVCALRFNVGHKTLLAWQHDWEQSVFFVY